jgi:uncharacterized protein (TIGR02266 family)
MASSATFVFGLIICFLGFLAVWLVYYFWKMQIPSDTDRRMSANAAQSGGKENREHPRMDINWTASLETSQGTVAGQVKNISVGGAFICCAKLLPIGEMFQLTMTAPDNEPMKAAAKVVWSNVNVPESKVVNRGMGVRFINMSEQHIRLVREICQESG